MLIGMVNKFTPKLVGRFTAVVVGFLFLLATQAYSALSLSYAVNRLTVTIDAPIDFTSTVSASGGLDEVRLVMVNLYTSGQSGGTGVEPTPSLALNSDGNSGDIVGFLNNSGNEVNSTDLLLLFDYTFAIGSGETLTVSSGIATSSYEGGFKINEPDNVSGTVEMFLADPVGNRISNSVVVAVVPEPGYTALIFSGVAALGIIVFRRRKSRMHRDV